MLEYLSALRVLSEFCEFGTELNTYLRDRFVCGINNSRMLQKLLSTTNLDLDKARTCALAIESATRDCEFIQGNPSSSAQASEGLSVMKLHSDKLRCYRCNDTKHLADKCPFKSNMCYFCNETGHLKRVCKKAAKKQARGWIKGIQC